MTIDAFKIIGSNAVATFGIALTSSTFTLALSKLGHYSFDVLQDIKKLHQLPSGHML
jgi:hypothetical protein